MKLYLLKIRLIPPQMNDSINETICPAQNHPFRGKSPYQGVLLEQCWESALKF